MSSGIMRKKNESSREGFSLIEMIIAIAIVGIVMSGVVLLIMHATNSMRRTTNQVTVQNQAKDALTHITSHVQESAAAKFYDADDTHVLIMVRPCKYYLSTPQNIDVSVYWLGDYTDPETSETEKVIYFREWKFPDDWGGTDYSDTGKSAWLNDKKDLIFDTILDDIKTSKFDAAVTSGDIFKEGETEKDPRTFILCKNVETFRKGTVTEAVSGGGVSTPIMGDDAAISDKSVTFTLKLTSKLKDTEFKTTKTIYLRNQ